MASVLPTETSSPTRVLYPSTRLVNSNIPLENGLFLKFACREWKNLAADALNPLNGSIANEFAADPDNVYSGMNDLIANIIVPAPKQVQFMSKIKYVDDANFVTGAINAASKVGSAITDLIVGVLASPLVGAASAIGGIARDELTGRRDLDSTNSMFSNAEKRGYNITFTLISTTKEEAARLEALKKLAGIGREYTAEEKEKIGTTIDPKTGLSISPEDFKSKFVTTGQTRVENAAKQVEKYLPEFSGMLDESGQIAPKTQTALNGSLKKNKDLASQINNYQSMIDAYAMGDPRVGPGQWAEASLALRKLPSLSSVNNNISALNSFISEYGKGKSLQVSDSLGK